MWGATQAVSADTYYFSLSPSAAGTVNSLTALVASGGTVSCTVSIAGTPITGLSNVSFNSSAASTTTAAAANTWTVGQQISLVAAISGTPLGFVATLNVT